MKKLICIILILCAVLTGCVVRDPGPPTEWMFNTAAGYFAMEEAMKMEDADLEAFAEDRGFWLVPGFHNIRENAECVREMVREVKIPQIDGYKMEFITVNPEVGRTEVFIRLQGAQTAHVLYTFEEKWEHLWKATLGIRGEEKINNPNAERLYFTERDENIEGEQIYRFGAVVDDKYVQIFVFGGTYEDAEKMVSAMRFVDIEELRR